MPVVTAQAPLPTTLNQSTGIDLKLGVQEAQPVSTEVTLEVPSAADPTEQRLSPKFAALARKEKLLRQEAERIKNERAAYEEEKKRYQTDYIPKSRLTQETMAVLAEAGITPDQLIQLQLQAPGPETQALTKLQQEIAALKKSQEDEVKLRSEAQQKQYDAALNQIRTDVKSLVASSEDYETIKETGSEEAVVELIKQTFDADGTMLGIDDASRQVEEFLIERAMKMAGLKKVKAKLAPPEPVAKATATPQPQKLPQSIKTLTNATTAAPSRPLTDKERRARAVAAFNGQLNS